MSKKLGRFGRTLLRTKIRTDNHPKAEQAKINVRRLVLDAIGAADAHVFDAFAGAGSMYRAVWHEAASYVGCDTTWYRDERLMYVGDNRRVMRAIDLSRFTVFDFDAYGAPWHQAVILSARRPLKPGERIGLVLTEGSTLKLEMGSYPTALRAIAGLRGKPAGGSRSHDELTDRALAGLCRRMGCSIARRWQATRKAGASVSYIGLILEGVAVERSALAPVAIGELV